MSLQPADYAFTGLATIMAVAGLFRGFSGTVAFVAATAASASATALGWTNSVRWFEPVWQRIAVTCAAAVVAFGVVRFAVKKSVNGLLAQPSDAFFGFLCGVLGAALLLAAWAYSGLYIEYSSLATALSRFIPGA